MKLKKPTAEDMLGYLNAKSMDGDLIDVLPDPGTPKKKKSYLGAPLEQDAYNYITPEKVKR